MTLIICGSELDDVCEKSIRKKSALALELGVTRQTLFNWMKAEGRLPRVFTLALYALEHMPVEERTQKGKKVRKRTKRQ